jgi:mycothiol synthase
MPTYPSLPAGYDWRPARLDDAARLSALFRAVDEVEGLEEVLGPEGVQRELTLRGVNPARDTLAALTKDGDIRGFAWVWAKRAQQAARAIVWVEAHPEHLHLEPTLLAWAEAAARPLLGPAGSPGRRYLRLHIEEHRTRRRRVVEGAGYRHLRTFVEMWRTLTGRLPEPASLPAGIEAVAWCPDLVEGTRHAANESFASHWDSMPVGPQDWQARVCDDPNFRPDLSRLALSGGRVVALCLASVDREHNAREGVAEMWLERIGTVPSQQRRGLATALTGRVLHAAAEAGFTRAGLGVDEDNTTRATAVYERLGFSATRRTLAYVKDLE